MNFVDTSTIVTASQPSDPAQPACVARLAKLEAAGGACAVHSLSELFAVLSRLPVPYRVPPEAAFEIVKHTSKRFTLVSLTASEHLATIQSFVRQGLTSAMIYDALILACARKVNSTRIYTRNVKHFRQIAPDLAARIVEP